MGDDARLRRMQVEHPFFDRAHQHGLKLVAAETSDLLAGLDVLEPSPELVLLKPSVLDRGDPSLSKNAQVPAGVVPHVCGNLQDRWVDASLGERAGEIEAGRV